MFVATLWTAGCDFQALRFDLSFDTRPVPGCDFPDALVDLGAKFNPYIASGQYWRLLTSAFLHLNLTHLLFNMFGLLTFGRIAEMVFGHLRFLAVYLVSALGGAALSYLLSPNLSVGASGAFFGIAGALCLFFFLNRRVRAISPQGQLGGLIVLLLINAGFGYVQQNVDNFGHAGGLLAGAFVGGALAPRFVEVRDEKGATRALRKEMSPPVKWLVVPIALAVIALAVFALPGASFRR
jgi:rhomboid protease GluP